jgi:hypothetical protein
VAVRPSTFNLQSRRRRKSTSLFAFFGGHPPRTATHLHEQEQQLTNDKKPSPECVQSSVAQRVLQWNRCERKSKGEDAAETAVGRDGRGRPAGIGVDNVCERARIDPAVCVGGFRSALSRVRFIVVYMEKKPRKKSEMHRAKTCTCFWASHAYATQASGRNNAAGFVLSKRIYSCVTECPEQRKSPGTG